MSNEFCFLVSLLIDDTIKKVTIVLRNDQVSEGVPEYPMDMNSREELHSHLPADLNEGRIIEVVKIWDVIDARTRATATKQYLNKMQKELFTWDKKNFGDQPAYRSLLGAFEEIGELAHAHLKEEQGIRASNYEEDAKDAIGDTIIYLANYCNARGFNLHDIIKDTWSQVRQRDWVKYPKTGRPDAVVDEPVSYKQFCIDNSGKLLGIEMRLTYIMEYLPSFPKFKTALDQVVDERGGK